MPKITRALISCHDKTGVVDLAKVLLDYDVEIVSTAGTLDTLAKAGIRAVNIAEFTGVPEMLDGRVKSLHPRVHAGLLGIRDKKLHCEQMAEHEFKWIDMLVVNPNPISEIVARPGISIDEVIEQIDIGGCAMIRSAAKNFRYVTVVVSPERYPNIIHELRALDGMVSFKTRFRLAREAYACTAEYDRVLSAYLERTEPEEE